MIDALRFAAWLVAAMAIGGALACLALSVGVVGGALWAGWSRDRDCERRGWRDLPRW